MVMEKIEKIRKQTLTPCPDLLNPNPHLINPRVMGTHTKGSCSFMDHVSGYMTWTTEGDQDQGSQHFWNSAPLSLTPGDTPAHSTLPPRSCRRAHSLCMCVSTLLQYPSEIYIGFTEQFGKTKKKF